MNWSIVADSSCELDKMSDGNVVLEKVPFVISIEGKEYVDDGSCDVGSMIDAMEKSKEVSRSACPSPHTWLEHFQKEGPVFAVTISKELSGSYNSACAAKHMAKEEDADKKIAIINSRSAGSGLVVLVRKLQEYIHKGLSFETIAEKIEEDRARCRTVFALCSFDNLIKNGRMSRISGFLAKRLGFWGIGIASDEGTIVVKDKTRGAKKALNLIIQDMKERGIPTERVVISHCQNQEMAEQLKAAVLEVWNHLTVEITATGALCSFYAERHGLIVTYL